MSSIYIIGIGSPYGDDQLGWKVIDQLKQSLPSDSSVNLLYCETPATDLLTALKQSNFAILIDAIHADLPIGKVCSWSQLSLLPETSLSSHGMGLSTLLQLAENLGQMPEKWVVCGIVIDPENKALHGVLSPEVLESMPVLLDYIQQQVV
ncbi:hydrogenase maturation protease [Candidatus Albibeggiatoa sp. nov. NOAA]|uniref:hydrogenase maturation protease n=1 Tax=Candidatus Albibeggiatoa sp. nov. NOAA TaxID=3162724 RepID=UPI0032FEA7F6|nr:hydrogenase maturation protease [Thiotrichaceae bacterium]